MESESREFGEFPPAASSFLGVAQTLLQLNELARRLLHDRRLGSEKFQAVE